MVSRRGYFHLPAVHLDAVHAGSDEYAAISIGFLLKIQIQHKVFVGLISFEITVFHIGATFTDKLTIFNIPLLGTVDRPARQILSVKDWFRFLGPGRSGHQK